MTTQVTQCPKCRTSFRVTEAQLNIANGAVRCGSCLHIFHAPDHWLDSTGQQTATGADRDTTARGPAQEPAPADEHPADTAVDQAGESPAQFSDELLSMESDTGTPADDIPSMPDALKSLDEAPEPAFNDSIQENALDDIFSDDMFGAEDEQETGFAGFDEEQEAIEESEPEEADYAAESAAEEPLTSTPEQQEIEEEDDLLISDDMDTDSGDSKSIRDTAQFSAIEIEEEEEFVFGIDDGEDDDDEESEYASSHKKQDTSEFSESFLDMDSWEDNSPSGFKDLDDLGDQSKGGEEDWARKLLEDEDEPQAKTTARGKPEPEPEEVLIEEPAEELAEEPEQEDPFSDIFEELDSDNQLDPELLDILNERDQAPEQSSPAEDEFILGDEPMLAGERIGHEKRSLLANIEPEPVVFTAADKRSRWLRIGWMAAIVVALLGFGAQYVYFNFDRLARDDSYRGALGSVCGVLGCHLPGRDDIRLIRSTNLIVRSHPKVRDALVVDAIITNRATFKQGFPDLELEFTNLHGEIVAARRFTPAEYLHGELSGLSQMPVKQPVHISLEIVDPGKQAVNYELHFYPPHQS